MCAGRRHHLRRARHRHREDGGHERGLHAGRPGRAKGGARRAGPAGLVQSGEDIPKQLRSQSLGRVFSHEQASSWESVVTSVRSKTKAVAARKMSPRSDWGSSILEASAATAKVNGASRSGTWTIT